MNAIIKYVNKKMFMWSEVQKYRKYGSYAHSYAHSNKENSKKNSTVRKNKKISGSESNHTPIQKLIKLQTII